MITLATFRHTLAVAVFAFVALATIAGCSFMGPRPTTQTFMLDPGKPPKARTMSGHASISFVDVASQFGRGNFQYRLSDSDWETDPYNRFLSSPQEMMTAVLRKWLGDSKQFSSILIPGEGGTSDIRVDMEVSELYIDFRNPVSPQAVITMEVALHRLENSGVGEQLLKRSFSARTAVSERTPEAFVSAWEVALRQNLLSLTAALR